MTRPHKVEPRVNQRNNNNNNIISARYMTLRRPLLLRLLLYLSSTRYHSNGTRPLVVVAERSRLWVAMVSSSTVKTVTGSTHLCWFAVTTHFNNYNVSQKTSHLWLAIILTYMNGFWCFFGRNVTDKVGNQKTLYYATSSNLCFCTTWQNSETRKSHFHSLGLCYTHNAPVRCLPERKSCHLWCVW